MAGITARAERADTQTRQALHGGQGGFEIRTFVAAAAAARGAKGIVQFCQPVPIFAVSCTVARMQIAA